MKRSGFLKALIGITVAPKIASELKEPMIKEIKKLPKTPTKVSVYGIHDINEKYLDAMDKKFER